MSKIRALHRDLCVLRIDITSVSTSGAEKIANIRTGDLAALLVPLRLMKVLAKEIGSTKMAERIQQEEEKDLAKLAQHHDLKTDLDSREQECLNDLALGSGKLILNPNGPEALLAGILRHREATASTGE